MLEGLVGVLPTSVLVALAPFRNSGAHFPTHKVLDVLQPYDHLPAPLSMRVSTEAELVLHEMFAQSIALAHNELAHREEWLRYPHHYCTTASTGVMLSLFAHNYPNAMVLRAQRPGDHSYVGLPYVLGDTNGVVLIDPTASQMEGRTESVLVERKSGAMWEYHPGWSDSANLYPDSALDHSRERTHANAGRTTSLAIRVNPLPCTTIGYADAFSYLQAAFTHPVNVGVPSRIGEILKNLVA